MRSENSCLSIFQTDVHRDGGIRNHVGREMDLKMSRGRRQECLHSRGQSPGKKLCECGVSYVSLNAAGMLEGPVNKGPLGLSWDIFVEVCFDQSFKETTLCF